MNKFLKIAGIVLVAWIAIGLVGLVFKLLVGAVFWAALIAGAVWVVLAVTGGRRKTLGGRQQYGKLT